MSIAMMAHLGYVPPQVFQIDPSLLAISPYIDPLPSITANATSPPPPPKKLKRKAAEGKGDLDKPKKPRKKPVRTPRPKSASPTNGEGADALLPIGALAAANTLGRHTKLACENCRARKTKCSRHTKCLSCIARGEECVWADGPPTLETPKPSSALEVEAHRLHRLVKILSARCVTREAILATQLGRAPRPVPTLADVPIPPAPPVQLPPLPKSSKRGKQQTDKSQRGGAGEQQQPSRDDIVVDFQAYNDYCNRHSANQESILEDARALLSLAADPIKSGTGSPFFVDDNVDPGQGQGMGRGVAVGVGLEVSAAAALAAAQAARQPLPFSQFTTSSAASAQRPPLPRSATTSALLHNGGMPTPFAAPTDSNGAAVITATQIEAYRSLAAQMGLDLNAAGSPDPYDGAEAFDSSAFEPVMESTMLPLPAPPVPMYYLPPPVPSAAAAETTRSASATSTATFFYPTLGASSSSHQSSDPNANAAAQQRRRLDPEWLSEREARHRARFDRAANEALTQQQQDEVEPVSQNGSNDASALGGLFRSQGYGYGYGYGRAHDHDNRDDDPMLLAPIETTRTLPPQQPPSLPPLPARRSSWLLSPILDPLSLPVPPSACSSSSIMQQQQQEQQRPHLSIDAAGAFAQTFREANPLSGSGASGGVGGGGGGGGGAISALFWRGLPSAATPLRSAFAGAGTTATAASDEAAGLIPFGSSKVRLWQDIVIDSPAGLLRGDDDDQDDDDDNDERFEPRPAGGIAAAADSLMMSAGGGGGGEGVLDEWERFQPRAANQTERTDLTVVEEREPEEQEPEEREQQQEEEGERDGGEEEPRNDGSAATGAEEEKEELLAAAASGGSPQTSAAAAVSVGAMEAEGSVEVAVAGDGGGSTTATVVGN